MTAVGTDVAVVAAVGVLRCHADAERVPLVDLLQEVRPLARAADQRAAPAVLVAAPPCVVVVGRAAGPRALAGGERPADLRRSADGGRLRVRRPRGRGRDARPRPAEHDPDDAGGERERDERCQPACCSCSWVSPLRWVCPQLDSTGLPGAARREPVPCEGSRFPYRVCTGFDDLPPEVPPARRVLLVDLVGARDIDVRPALVPPAARRRPGAPGPASGRAPRARSPACGRHGPPLLPRDVRGAERAVLPPPRLRSRRGRGDADARHPHLGLYRPVS